MSKRDNSIDIAKAIGIILVVLGHTQFRYGQVIYQFHLPLFFFLSGVVFNEKKIDSPKTFLISKIKGLYWPFVKFELIFLIFHNIFWKIHLYTEFSNTQGIYGLKKIFTMVIKILTMGGGEQLTGPLWFLISSFEIVILFAVLIKILSHTGKYCDAILLIICVLVFYVGCLTDLPRMGSQSLIGLFFFGMGYFYKKYKTYIKMKLSIAIVLSIIVMLCASFNYVDISQLAITHKWMLMISGISGSYFVLYLAKMVDKIHMDTIKNFLKYCGRNTIYILALHCISFKIVMVFECLVYHLEWDYLGTFPSYEIAGWWCIPLTILGVILPLVIKKLIDRSNLYLGKEYYDKKVG